MSDIVERLHDIWSNDDHARGCQGREYDCTCGFDSRTFATAKEAADTIEALRQKLLAAEKALRMVSGLDIHHEVLRAVDAAIAKVEGTE